MPNITRNPSTELSISRQALYGGGKGVNNGARGKLFLCDNHLFTPSALFNPTLQLSHLPYPHLGRPTPRAASLYILIQRSTTLKPPRKRLKLHINVHIRLGAIVVGKNKRLSGSRDPDENQRDPARLHTSLTHCTITNSFKHH